MKLTKKMIVGGVSALLCSMAFTANASTYPAGNIQFIVPFSPGGGTDLASRVLSEKVGREKGWNFVVENRPGAGGSVGLAMLARAKPTGLSLAMGQTSNLSINPSLNKDVTYKPMEDFTPITLVASQPMVVVSNPNSGYDSFEALIAAAKAEQGAITMATPGIGTVSHLSMEYFAKLADLKFAHIPYPGATQAVTDAVGGHVNFAATSLPSALSHIKAGSLKALAVTSIERSPALPDVPTIAELGYEGFDVSDWKAVVGPAGMDPEVVMQIDSALREALATQSVKDAFAIDGSRIEAKDGSTLKNLIALEYSRWAEFIKDAGLAKE